MNNLNHSSLAPELGRIKSVATSLGSRLIRTPTVPWPVPVAAGGPDVDLFIKLELLQRTGSFKARGALNTVAHLIKNADSTEFPGITAFSAGNHAIAAAFAAKESGISAKVVMPNNADPFRMRQCEAYGAEIVLGESIADLIAIVDEIKKEEGRELVHPFEGIHTIEGTATVGLELCEDTPELDAVIVPVGGGGLIAGIACAVKQMQTKCQVIGVEPAGANGMQQSLEKGQPMDHVQVDTIADSLGAPMHAPLSFSVIEKYVDDIVTVSDEQMREGMRKMYSDMKLAVEPACAAGLAALSGPLAGRFAGKRVALVACGSNIDPARYARLLGS